MAAFFAWRATHWAKEAAGHTKRSADADNAALAEARKATEAARSLEKPYPYAVLNSDGLTSAFDAAVRNPGSSDANAPIWFHVKNYGKTPATILHIIAEIAVERPEPYVRNIREEFFPKEVVIGEGGATEEFIARTSEKITAEEYKQLHSGESTLYFRGYVVFRTVWDETETTQFGWKYNAYLGKWMTLETKADHKPSRQQ